MTACASLNAETQQSVFDELAAHLAKKLNPDYATWVAGEIAELCRIIRSRDTLQLYAKVWDAKCLLSLRTDAARWATTGVRFAPPRRPGRPRDWTGDSLIRWIADYCAPYAGRPMPRETEEGHFEYTCRMAFWLADLDDPVDLAGKVSDALKGTHHRTDRAKALQHIWRASQNS